MTIWFDVEDLIRFFQIARRPTGIQRLSFEVCAAMQALDLAQDVGFCCRNEAATHLRRVDFTVLSAQIQQLMAQEMKPPPPKPAPPSGYLYDAARRLPLPYRLPLGEIYRGGRSVLRAFCALGKAFWAGTRRPSVATRPAETLLLEPLTLQAGDWLVHLGASWENPYSKGFLDGLARQNVQVCVFAHDMIPDLFPEWCTQSMVEDFRRWLDTVTSRVDRVLGISHNTLKDLAFCLQRRGHVVPACSLLPPGGQGAVRAISYPRPLAQPYVLMVGTIEARKNHVGMLRVWRQLLKNPPEAGVPLLVFAGKAGWLTADLMQQLENADYLDGAIRFIDQPSESQLAALYQHCLFTVYPSFYEGWGLPVTESLSFGKPVAASRSSAIPEAGGLFCGYYDPDDMVEAHQLIRYWLDEPEQVAALSTRIEAEFIPPDWQTMARALLATLAG